MPHCRGISYFTDVLCAVMQPSAGDNGSWTPAGVGDAGTEQKCIPSLLIQPISGPRPAFPLHCLTPHLDLDRNTCKAGKDTDPPLALMVSRIKEALSAKTLQSVSLAPWKLRAPRQGAWEGPGCARGKPLCANKVHVWELLKF